MYNLFDVTSKYNFSCSCLDGSGLKLVFYWKAPFVFLSKFLQSGSTVTFGSFIIVNKEVSSAVSFGSGCEGFYLDQ